MLYHWKDDLGDAAPLRTSMSSSVSHLSFLASKFHHFISRRETLRQWDYLFVHLQNYQIRRSDADTESWKQESYFKGKVSIKF